MPSVFCSTIIPTIARRKLDRAVRSVLDQAFTQEAHEIIVVNDSGQPLPVADWQQAPCVRLLETPKRERCVARNTGAAVARGRYLHFLDDDDWLLPGALESMWDLSTRSDAAWLYGGTQLVNRQGKNLIQLHHHMNGNAFTQVMAGEWIPLQASWIRDEAFFQVGGFDPDVKASQDVHLARCIALHGEFAETMALVATVEMGKAGSTTDYDNLPQYSRRAREKLLESAGVFSRLRTSAREPYWKGRIVRCYLTSMVWNIERTRIATAISRLANTMLSTVWAGSAVMKKDFWQAVLHPYRSFSFQRGFNRVE